jgi:hypothetical protein
MKTFIAKHRISILLVGVSMLSVLNDAVGTGQFIGHADQAEVANCARSISEGRGPVVDCIWLVSGDPSVTLTHRIRYWSLYVAYWVGGFYTLFGATRLSSVLAASVIKAAMGIVAFAYVKSETKNPKVALSVASVLMLDPTWTRRANLLSDLYLTAATVIAFCLALWLCRKPRLQIAFLLGAVTGLAIGFKPTGITLGILPLMTLWSEEHRQRLVVGIGSYIIGLFVALLPLLSNNWIEARTLIWPDAKHVAQAAKAAEHVGYDAAMYGTSHPEEAQNVSPPMKLFKMAKTTLHVFRGIAFHEVASPWLIALIGVSIFTLRSPLNAPMIFAIAIALAGISFLVILVNYEPRYYVHLFAPALIAINTQRNSLAKSMWSTYAVLLVIGTVFWIPVKLKHSDDRPEMSTIRIMNDVAAALPKDAVVMTPDPWEFTFHTRYPTVALPVVDDWQQVNEVAKRYGVTHIVLVEGNHRCQLYSELNAGTPSGPLTNVQALNGAMIAPIAEK